MTRHPGSAPEWLIHVVAIASLALSMFYIGWRWAFTINTDVLWYSVPLALAESYGLLTAFFLTFTAWSIRRRHVPPAPDGRAVDVFVTTYNESLAIIRKTALAAREIRYPHATYILDDGRRDEVRALADEVGVGYLRRATNDHAKAGNLNNALQHTAGDFVLQLDADHVPLPQMVERLLGFFADERVAFVQSPQDFYNTDAFTYDVDEHARRIWEDQQLFFRVLQPGKDRVNAAFFVGSCAMLRRAALEDIGGFATGTVTEDIETSLLLHARGWRSVYLNETLAYGLAPANARAFHVQHLRWGQGAMQVLRKHRPLRLPGLTVSQRIAYLDSLTTYLGGFQRLILYLAPIVFFTTGEFPLRANAGTFAAIFIPYMVLQFASFKLLARGHGSLLLADRYAMAKFVTHLRAITGFMTRRRLRFRVTPKTAAAARPGAYAPQAALVLVTALSIAWAGYERATSAGTLDDVPGWGSSAFWANVLFAVWNAGVATHLVLLSLRGKHRRVEHRFADALGVVVRVPRQKDRLASSDIAIVDNLNPYGASVRCMYAIDPGIALSMSLPLHRNDVGVRGRVVHRREQATPYGAVHVHGVEFYELSREASDAIELHCAHHSTPLERQRYVEGGPVRNGVLRRLREFRAQPRASAGMPARVVVSANGSSHELGVGLIENVSPDGARLLLDHQVVAGSTLRVCIPGTDYDSTGRVAFVRALETSVGMRFIVGFDTGSGAGRISRGGRRLYESIMKMGRARPALAGPEAAMETGSLPAPPGPAEPVLAAVVPADQLSTTTAVLPAVTELAEDWGITIPTVSVLVMNPLAESTGSGTIASSSLVVEVTNPLAESANEHEYAIAVPTVHVDVANPFPQFTE